MTVSSSRSMQVNHKKHASAHHEGIMIAAVCALIMTLLVTERAYGQAPDVQAKVAGLAWMPDAETWTRVQRSL